MASLWPWLAIAGLGALHGLNPAGWMLPAACGMRSRDRRRTLAALLPLGVGHVTSMALVAGAVASGLSMDRLVLQAIAAALLVAAVVGCLARGVAPPARALAGHAGLALWSFLLSSAHGAGLMLVPALVPLCAQGVADDAGADRWTSALAAVGVHTAAMLVVTGVLALGACRGTEAVAGLLGRRRQAGPGASTCPDPAGARGAAAVRCGHGFSVAPPHP